MPRPPAPRPLTINQMNDLLEYLEERLDGRGCDETTRHVEAFLSARGLDVSETLAWLQDFGAWCDCEVWINVR